MWERLVSVCDWMDGGHMSRYPEECHPAFNKEGSWCLRHVAAPRPPSPRPSVRRAATADNVAVLTPTTYLKSVDSQQWGAGCGCQGWRRMEAAGPWLWKMVREAHWCGIEGVSLCVGITRMGHRTKALLRQSIMGGQEVVRVAFHPCLESLPIFLVNRR